MNRKRDSTTPAWSDGPKLGHWWSWGALLLALLLSLVGTTFVGIGTSRADGLDWSWLGWGLGVLVAGIVLNVVNQYVGHRFSRKIDARRSKNLASFNHPLTDVFSAFEELLANDGPRAGQRFYSDMVRAASKMFPYDGVRVCVYTLEAREADPTETSAGDQDETVWLLLSGFGGRPDQPRPEFVPGEAHCDEAIACAQGYTVERYDSADKRLEISMADGAQYRAFMRLPITSRKTNRSVGLLTLDTTKFVEFTSQDVTVASNIARLIAIGLDRLGEAGDDVEPEARDARHRINAEALSEARGRLTREQEGSGGDA